MLGLGSQIRPQIERRFGVAFDHPVDRMRDTVEAVRAILRAWQDGTPLDHRGPYRTHTMMTPMFDPGPSPWGPPPVHLGALGPRMTEMAAEVADGLLVMPFTSERFFTGTTMRHVDAGLARAGRTRADLSLVAELIVCVGRTDAEMAEAEAGTRALLGFYGSTPSYRPVLEVEGRGEMQPELRRLSKEGRWGEMGDLVDDELLATIAVRGTPAEVAAQLADRYHGVADRVAVYLPYGAADDLLADLAAAVREAVGARVSGPEG